MQKSITFLSLFLMLCILCSASCEKQPEVEPDIPEKLIVGTWLRTRYEFSNSKTNGAWVEWNRPACEYDITEEFTSDGKWITNIGSGVCTGNTATAGSTYRIEDNGTKLILTFGNNIRVMQKNIEGIDKTTLVTIHDIKDVDNSQMRMTYTRK